MDAVPNFGQPRELGAIFDGPSASYPSTTHTSMFLSLYSLTFAITCPHGKRSVNHSERTFRSPLEVSNRRLYVFLTIGLAVGGSHILHVYQDNIHAVDRRYRGL